MFAILVLAVVLSGAGCCVFGLVLGAFGGLVVDLWSSVVGFALWVLWWFLVPGALLFWMRLAVAWDVLFGSLGFYVLADLLVG